MPVLHLPVRRLVGGLQMLERREAHVRRLLWRLQLWELLQLRLRRLQQRTLQSTGRLLALSGLLSPVPTQFGHRAGMWRLLNLQLPMVRELSAGVLPVMEALAQPLPESRTERLLALAVSPHLIATAIVAGAAGVAAVGARDLPLWLIVVAGAAGWSSTWSP